MLFDKKGNVVNPPRNARPEFLAQFKEVFIPTKHRDPKGMFSLGQRAVLKGS
jgi:hypothetical protein